MKKLFTYGAAASIFLLTAGRRQSRRITTELRTGLWPGLEPERHSGLEPGR